MKHLLLASALVMFSASAQAPGARLYDLVIEIGMPNLDENLRYATTHERRCLDTRDLSRAFPVLSHVSLQDCALVISSHDVNGDDYTLQCRGGHGTTGSARWHFDGATIQGTLNVKLGGKNMTFHQRMSGRAVGLCDGQPIASGVKFDPGPLRAEAPGAR